MKRMLMTAVLALGIAGVAAASTDPKPAKPTPPKDSAMQQIDAMIAKAKVDTKSAGWRTRLAKPDVATFDSAHTYLARMVTTKGTIVIKFMPKLAPLHVTNFIYLARLGFYDGLAFHRVIPGFMAQGGCPLGSGGGGPGYGFGGEFSPSVKHDHAGMLSMANTGMPNSDGSQFFLTFAPTPWLDGKHSIFGDVAEGMDVMKKLEAAGTSPAGKPSEPLKMEKVTIEVK